MITATGLELRAGARILLEPITLRVQPGDRIGLVGRNGAGKTTSLRVLVGESLPHTGQIARKGPVGYLPQDPRTGDLDVTARDRVLSARGLDQLVTDIAKVQVQLAETPEDDALIRRYGNLEERFTSLGGYAAESDAAGSAPTSACPTASWPRRSTRSPGGQRRRVELARILFADSAGEPTTLLLDEPTNHLDADSITWLRDFLRQHSGGLIVISHDVELLDAVVNKVWYLDANRAAVDVYNVGWKTYLQQRETDERRRHRERANAERKIESLRTQADKMRAKATKAAPRTRWTAAPAALAAGLAEVRASDKVARLRFPAPAPCGRTPLTAEGLSKSYGSLEVFTDVDLAVDRGARVVVLGLNGAGKTTLLRLLGGIEAPTPARSVPGTACGSATTRRSTRRSTTTGRCSRTCAAPRARSAGPDLNDTDLRKILGAFLFSGDDVDKPAGVLSGGEKTRLALAMLVTGAANVLLLDEPTNNLDPVSREQVLDALRTYAGAIVLVTHDEGAVTALAPEKVILLPDGIEDSWSDELADLISLA